MGRNKGQQPAQPTPCTAFSFKEVPTLYGLEAISSHNGWAMAVAGIIIVFSGLVVLSSTIAQLHKVLGLLNGKAPDYQNGQGPRRANGTEDAPASDPTMHHNLAESARQFRLIAGRISESFPLPRLIELAELSGLPRPHSTINDLLKAGLIVPDGKGYFFWKQ